MSSRLHYGVSVTSKKRKIFHLFKLSANSVRLYICTLHSTLSMYAAVQFCLNSAGIIPLDLEYGIPSEFLWRNSAGALQVGIPAEFCQNAKLRYLIYSARIKKFQIFFQSKDYQHIYALFTILQSNIIDQDTITYQLLKRRNLLDIYMKCQGTGNEETIYQYFDISIFQLM